MQKSTIYTAWFTGIIALIAWAGVVWLVLDLQSTQAQYLSDTQHSVNTSGKNAQAFNLHAELADTADDRSEILTLLAVDPTTLAETINQAGTVAGITLQIQNASPEPEPANSPTQAFDFSITGVGTFAQIVYVTQLLGALPVPSSIQSLQVLRAAQNTDVKNSPPWQLNAVIRIVTAANSS